MWYCLVCLCSCVRLFLGSGVGVGFIGVGMCCWGIVGVLFIIVCMCVEVFWIRVGISVVFGRFF